MNLPNSPTPCDEGGARPEAPDCFSCGNERGDEPIVNDDNGRPGVWYCRRCCVWTLAARDANQPDGPAQGDLFAASLTHPLFTGAA